MKCPLLLFEHYTSFEKIGSEVADCLQEECAWWYKENRCCAILTLAQGSTYIHKELLRIDSKIPLGILK